LPLGAWCRARSERLRLPIARTRAHTRGMDRLEVPHPHRVRDRHGAWSRPGRQAAASMSDSCQITLTNGD
jgi:hypothetical protein